MTEFSWRNLTFDEEADTHLLDYFCKRGTSEKDPTKHGKLALFGLLLKYMVASGALVIEIIEEGVPILSRGNVQPTSGRVQHRALQGTDNNLRVASNESSQTQTQLQQAHLQQTPSWCRRGRRGRRRRSRGSSRRPLRIQERPRRRNATGRRWRS
jgi:hypothetical protein